MRAATTRCALRRRCLLVGGILSACSPAAMGPVTVFVDPGKYQYYLRAARWSEDALDGPRAGIEAADGQGRAGHGRTSRQCHRLPG